MASDKSNAVLDRIANTATEVEKKALVAWADTLLTIKGSDRSVIAKVKESTLATAKFETIKPLIAVIGKELTPRELSSLADDLTAIYKTDHSNLSKTKQATTLITKALKEVAWDNRGLSERLGIAAVLVTLVTVGGQGAGIAALGTAIGVPLWVLFGAGAAFLGQLYERFTGKRRPETTYTIEAKPLYHGPQRISGPKSLVARAITPKDVRRDGGLTSPRSYGVYEIPQSATGTRRFRIGNYPVRMHELEREFGSCKLTYLYLQRSDALAMASELNGRDA